MKNSVKDLRLLVILIGITILVGMNYWGVDIDNEYNCITFLEKESDFEYTKVIIKGKYGKSLFRGDRFKGTVTVDDKIYPYMLAKIKGGTIPNRHTFKLKRADLIVQKIKKYPQINGFKIGYEPRSDKSFKYKNFGKLYFDEGMKNIVIYVYNQDGTAVSSSKPPKRLMIATMENKNEAIKFIHEHIPFSQIGGKDKYIIPNVLKL